MKTILVVDDSPLIRKAIRRIIEPLGFSVDEAGDGAQALERMERGPAPAAILLDVEMPVMDGMTFLKTLRGRLELAQPPVIMCTTVNAMETIVDAIQSGANEYVMKPFNEAIIGEKLEGVGLVA